MKRSNRTVGIGALFAVGAGFVAGILTAPKSGKETRSDIATASKHIVTEAEHSLCSLHTELVTHYEILTARAAELKGSSRKEAEHFVKTAKIAKDKASQAIYAFRDGESTDEDLAIAAKEAENAINHIKEFLKK